MTFVSGDSWRSVFAKNTLPQRGNGSAQTVLSEWYALERQEDDKGLIHASHIIEFEERLSISRATFQYTDGLLVFSSGGVCSFGGLWKTGNESPEVISMPSSTLAYVPQAFVIRHSSPLMLILGAAMGFSNVRVNIPAQAPVVVSGKVPLAQYARSLRLMSVLSKFTGASLKSDVSDHKRIQLRDPSSQHYGLACEACGMCVKCAITSLENQLLDRPSALKHLEMAQKLKAAWYEYLDTGAWLQLDEEDIDYPYITWLYESGAHFRSLVV